MDMSWIKKLHWQIVISLGFGLIFGIVAAGLGWSEWTEHWIAPFGTVFMNLLKLCAIPLVIVSLVCGVASLSDTTKLSRLGGRTMLAYVATTAIAITIGLVVANLAGFLTPEMDLTTRDKIIEQWNEKSSDLIQNAEKMKNQGPLQAVVDIIPDNFFASLSSNRNMLQVVFISLFFGVTLILIPKHSARPVIEFFNGLNECLVKAVRMVILMAPIGVFSLLTTAITRSGGDAGMVIGALAIYGSTVVLALGIHAALVYPAIIHFFTPISIRRFFKAIWPAQTFAFSTSSSAATLPITMDVCHRNLGIPRENCSFILPLGATINMDGTALYQAVATIFLANVMQIELSLWGQFQILIIALMASIGTAAVPSAGMVMLVVILEQMKIPTEAIGLIWALDRPLDMLRTAVNVTGDTAVATWVSSDELENDIDYGSGSTNSRQTNANAPRPRNRNNRRRPQNRPYSQDPGSPAPRRNESSHPSDRSHSPRREHSDRDRDRPNRDRDPERYRDKDKDPNRPRQPSDRPRNNPGPRRNPQAPRDPQKDRNRERPPRRDRDEE